MVFQTILIPDISCNIIILHLYLGPHSAAAASHSEKVDIILNRYLSYVVFLISRGPCNNIVITGFWVPYPRTEWVANNVLGTSSRRMLMLMLRRTGRVAVAAVAGVVGVVGNVDDARFHLFSEGAGLVCSFRFFFCFGP